MADAGKQKTIPKENPEQGRCNFFLSGKKARFCRSLAVAGQRYCGNHLHVDAEASSPAALERVPCPLDPSHTVLKTELEVHVTKRCPALALVLRERAQPHFCEGINEGSDCEPDLPPPPPAPAPVPARAAVDPVELAAVAATRDGDDGGGGRGSRTDDAAGVITGCGWAAEGDVGGSGGGQGFVAALNPFQKGRAAQRAALARSLGEPAFLQLLERIESAYAAVCGGRPPAPCVLRPPECEEMLAAPSDHRPFDLKHGLQQASIAGNMQRVGLLGKGPQGGSGVAVVELGAGKGYLGATLAASCGVGRLVATDIKAGLKLKADRHLRHIVFGRHRVDLKDYVPAATPELASAPAGTPWLAVAKHLCGAATDFGLRACMHRPEAHAAACKRPGSAGGAADPRVAGAPALGAEGQQGPAAEGAPGAAAAAAAGKRPRREAGGADEHRGACAGQQLQQPQLEQPQEGDQPQDEERGIQLRAMEAGAGREEVPGRLADGQRQGAAEGAVQGREAEQAQREQGRQHKSQSELFEEGRGQCNGPAKGNESCSSTPADTSKSGSGGGGAVLRGLAIAPCCHHRCGWRAYVGKPLFRRLGFSPLEFELMSWMTGWALCGHDTPAGSGNSNGEADADTEDVDVPAPPTSQEAAAPAPAPAVQQQAWQQNEQQPSVRSSFNPVSHLPRDRRMAVGQMCKQLIDAGRLEWLQGRFQSAELVSYIGPEVTGENRLLLAVQPLAADAC
ncbi:hypothetical protein Agub_g11732 [Astrephomene gubernaculifera]|uniref:tRNA:m(4)X modification enzyme TRM13 n=1 Tax=Astrephomene gubernaculifera TaxID=47775 RepID=A0AAD3DZB4_9CHLO|nr:hypothetical protein Agub_g11732 [Astrephomene gubernaculifera]